MQWVALEKKKREKPPAVQPQISTNPSYSESYHRSRKTFGGVVNG
jgi:hypothetical protein